MLKALIVDDDRLILEDICSLIRWESCGFQAPAAAESAGQALEILEKTQVDLVITDISMPKISGVELIRLAKKRFPDIVFAVLSNYDDFIYVKEAMKAGAAEYLLKYEVEPDTLRAFLAQMSRRIREERRSAKDREELTRMQRDIRYDLCAHFWRQVYSGGLDEKPLCGQAERLEIPVKGGAWIPVLAELSDGERTEEAEGIRQAAEETASAGCPGLRIYGTAVEKDLLFLAVYIPEVSFLLLTAVLARTLKVLQERFLCIELPAFLCSGRICMHLKELPEGVGKMKEHGYLRFYMGYGQAQMGIEETVSKGVFPRQEWEKVLSALETGGTKQLEEELSRLEEAVLRERPEEETLKRNILQGFAQWPEKQREEAFAGRLEREDTCSGVFSLLREKAMEYSRANQILIRIGRREIRETVNDLYRDYDRALPLEQAAGKACMSKAYFCKVFKDEVGTSYTDFLNQIRIGRAKQLLRQSSLHTREIAERTGFSDYRYFCRLFKNLTGKTCGEYRKGRVERV